MDELVWSDGLLDQARETRDDVAEALGLLGVEGELVLTGGSSVAGALTRGDIDLHLRVDPDAFNAALTRLKAVYAVASPQSWSATLAVFDVPARLPTGLAVTPIGSEHDQRFCLSWQALRRDPVLLAQYNDVKSATVGTGEYEERKSAFFSSLVRDDVPRPGLE